MRGIFGLTRRMRVLSSESAYDDEKIWEESNFSICSYERDVLSDQREEVILMSLPHERGPMRRFECLAGR